MNRITLSAGLWLAAAMMAAALTGCTSRTQAFPGYTPNQVWTAMQAVAESPEYDDWRLTMNEVWVDDETARIEVYREARRSLRRPGARPLNQRRTWRFQILLEGEDPPTAKFVSRGMGIPAHAVEEAERYFVDVRKLLGPEQMDLPQQEAPAAEPASHEVEPEAAQPDDAAKPPLDIDDVK